MLSTNSLKEIYDGKMIDENTSPTMQVISFKQISGQAIERYRLQISDGNYVSTFAMLATNQNSLIHSGTLNNFCIIKLKKFMLNAVGGNKKVLVIMEIEVLKSGDEIGSKIGNPVPLDSSSSKPQTNSFASNRASSNSAGGPVGAQNVPPGMTSVHPIASLTPYQNRWTIRARVTNKSAIRTWSNSRGEGKLFNMDLLDESGEIRATAFKEQCDKFYNMIEIDKVFFISQAQLKTANKQFSNLNNDYEMAFTSATQVVPCYEQTEIPAMQFSFVSIDQIERIDKDTFVDVIGICKSTDDVTTLNQRSTGKELKKRDIAIVDNSNVEIRLTLWSNQAEDFDGSGQPVVAIKSAKVSDFNGKSLSMMSSSSLQINPDIEEAHKLRAWFDKDGNSVTAVNLSNQRLAGSAIGNNFKCLAEAKLEKLGFEAPDYYSTKATVVFLKKENCLYPACPSEGCNKKVIDQNNGAYRCEKCNREFDSFNWRLLLNANIADTTENQWVTLFQDQAETILGKTAQELGSLRDADNDTFRLAFADASFKEYIFKLRVKMETYNEETRLKTTVVSASPLNTREYNQKLIADIKKMSE